ncbi:MAG: hypothetical protein QOD75_2029 [Blastocatellia bacterium]|jgi:hypothetical protein|nr:hypothetical protein [Blastocatellia bacterium]
MTKYQNQIPPALAVLASFLLLASYSTIILAQTKPASRITATARARRDLKLSGGFIQYWNDMMEWEWQDAGAPSRMPYPVNWTFMVKSMRDIGMTMVVIQQLEYKQTGEDEPTRLYKVSDTSPALPRQDDTTEKILVAADPDMTVFLGLVDAQDWKFESIDKPIDELENYLLGEQKGLATKSIAAADRIWALYHSHGSFKAWYVPLEIWNFNFTDNSPELRKKKIELVRRFWKKITDHLAILDRRDNKKRRVAIAPYFNPTLADAKATEGLYSELLNGAGINILMLQDGVGARSMDSDWPKLREYYGAFRSACKRTSVEFWTDTEIYQPTTRAADIERLKKQLEIESEFTDTAVAWDFYQYMNPVVDDCCFDEEGRQIKCKNPTDPGLVCVSKNNRPIINASATDRRTLYEAYKKLIADVGPRVSKSHRNRRR